ncbi:MAG: thioredoxin family protein [Firmicutes bacterium]|nr:thioredoxin family protein [Bacillota bacterium]
MNVNELTDIIGTSKKPVIGVFSASWCGPCRMFAPKFESVSKRLGNEFVFAKIDADECEELCESYGIASVPTIIMFINGVEAKRKGGAFATEADFEKWIKG